jgi:hypothetical protein
MIQRRGSYGLIYLAVLLLSLGYASTIYINSNYLALYFAPHAFESLYILGALGNLIGLAAGATLIRRFGNFQCLLFYLGAEAFVLLGLTQAHTALLVGLFFVFEQMLPPLILFSFDVVLERAITSESITGTVRSLYLVASNCAFVVAPAIAGIVAERYSYQSVYAIAGVLVVTTLVLIDGRFSRSESHHYRQVNILDSIRRFPARHGLQEVFSIDFLLQCFYAMMTIFTPLYLHLLIGFDWLTIGLIFTVMLLPFVIFEAPLGKLFDLARHVTAERDTIMIGFSIMSASCIVMYAIQSRNPIAWATLLFISRIGASFVEVGSEYSFFRRVNDSDAGFISIFRSTYPFSYVVAPLLLACIGPLPSQTAFICMALITFVGIFVAYRLPPRPRRV